MLRVNDRFMLWVEVDLLQLRRNLKILRASIGKAAVQILAIVKADAYGHGMRPVSRAFVKEGVRFFGVANIDEAVVLRRVCPPEARILVLGCFHENQLNLYRHYRVIPTVCSFEDLAILSRRLKNKQTVFPIHVKIDTGMGRLGLWHTQTRTFFKKILKTKNIYVEGVYTHFSCADDPSCVFTQKQMVRFNRAVMQIRMLGIMPLYLHAANSMGLLRFKNSHFNLVRPGIVLYGLSPSKSYKVPDGIHPVLSLKCRIALLKEFEAGTSVSYGGTYRTPKRTRIAVLPIGYSYGYRIAYSNKASVIVKGIRCPVVGRVTMDQTLVDVGRVSSVKRWDTVTLIGQEGGESVAAQDLADIIQSIPYEVVCSLHSRIPRIFKHIR